MLFIVGKTASIYLKLSLSAGNLWPNRMFEVLHFCMCLYLTISLRQVGVEIGVFGVNGILVFNLCAAPKALFSAPFSFQIILGAGNLQ